MENPTYAVAEMPNDWEGFKELFFSEENYDPYQICKLLHESAIQISWKQARSTFYDSKLHNDYRFNLLARISDLNFDVLDELIEEYGRDDNLGYISRTIYCLSSNSHLFTWRSIKNYIGKISFTDSLIRNISEKVPFEELKPFLADQSLSINMKREILLVRTEKYIKLDQLDWITQEVPFVLIDSYATCLRDEDKCIFIDRLGMSFVKSYMKELSEINAEEKEKNINAVNEYQKKVLSKNGIDQDVPIPSRLIEDGKRTAYFYIRVKNIKKSYQFLLETLFRFTKCYISKSPVFDDLKVLPRRRTNEFSVLLEESDINRVEGTDDFVRACVCNANMIHFSEGTCDEYKYGSLSMIGLDLDEYDDRQRNEKYAELRLMEYQEQKDSFYDVMKSFLEDFQNFEKDILEDAGIAVPGREAQKVVDMVKEKTK